MNKVLTFLAMALPAAAFLFAPENEAMIAFCMGIHYAALAVVVVFSSKGDPIPPEDTKGDKRP